MGLGLNMSPLKKHWYMSVFASSSAGGGFIEPSSAGCLCSGRSAAHPGRCRLRCVRRGPVCVGAAAHLSAGLLLQGATPLPGQGRDPLVSVPLLSLIGSNTKDPPFSVILKI